MAYDKNLASELGKLTDAAYAQFQDAPAWLPAPYTLSATFSAIEPWKIRPVTALIPQLPQLHFPPGIQAFTLPQFNLPHFTLPQLPIPTPSLPAPVPFGFVAIKGDEAFVVIRGTLTPLEWLADFTILPIQFKVGTSWGRTTQGFKSIFDQIGHVICDQLKFLVENNKVSKVFVTGHSLGAALAHLVAAEISQSVGIIPICYTFSGPRAGDPEFAQAYAKAGIETWRIFNTEDIVPTLPLAAVELVPLKLGLTNSSAIEQVLEVLIKFMPTGLFQHVGTPLAVTFQKGDIADNHNLTNTYSALS